MIANITKGRDFGQLLKYLLNPSKGGTILASNLASDTVNQMAREFEMVAAQNIRTKTRVRHISLAFSPEDGEVSPGVQVEIATRLMEELGYTDNQYIIVSHPRSDHDHNHDHLHIATSAVKLDGQHVRDSWDWRKAERILRQIESDYQLTQVKSSKETEHSLPSKGQQERLRREEKEAAADPTRPAPQRPVSDLIQGAIADAVDKTSTMADFVAHLQAQGVNVLPKITRTGVVQGFSYQLDGIAFAGNKLRGCSFPKLQQRGIEYDPIRDLPNLKLVAGGVKLPPPVTLPEISKNGNVTNSTAVTLPRIDDTA